MSAPKCRVCETNHWAREPHFFPDSSRVTSDGRAKKREVVKVVSKTAPRAEAGAADQASPIKHDAESIKHRMAALGRVGGPRGGAARAARLSPERRREIAQAGARARWAKYGTPEVTNLGTWVGTGDSRRRIA